jgi:hypothetical protein
MNEKITSLLLVCLVSLSIFYGCSTTASSSHTIQSIDAVPSRPTNVTEEPGQNAKLAYPELTPLGDPIDDPVPHNH